MSSDRQESADNAADNSVDAVLDAIRGRFAAEERRQDETVAASIKARGVLDLTEIVQDGDIDVASVAPTNKATAAAPQDTIPAAGLEQSIAAALTEGLQAALMADPDAIPDAIESRLDAILSPLVRDWLDANLADIVVRVLREEIAQRPLDR
ncbi:MAG: DUF2497 domain-containing protein [Alphaproteobacteria bacterium]